MDFKDLLIFGAGSHARKLAKAFLKANYNVQGFVTSKTSATKEDDGIPLFSWETLPDKLKQHCQLVCGIFNRGDAYEELASVAQCNGFQNMAWPWDYYPLLHQELGWCYWMDSEPKMLVEWQQEASYNQLVSTLADDESKITVNRLLNFRSGADLQFSSFRSGDAQYFNSITLKAVPSDRAVSFLDVGAYDGDTLNALRKHKQIGKAMLMEPDPENYQKLVRNLQASNTNYQDTNILTLPLGAGAEFGSFAMTGDGEAATLAGADEESSNPVRYVTVVRLDDAIPQEIFDFVKIDVEGNDRAAIEGMKKLLRRSRPVIAVSLYHRPRDIIELSLAVIDLLEGIPYSFHIRQHMYNSFDTVLYAVPVRPC